MILGKIVEGRVVLPVSFCLSQTTELAIDFVVDTGFNGYLTLPSPAVAALKDTSAYLQRSRLLLLALDCWKHGKT
jgi:predicted aspartyl protease